MVLLDLEDVSAVACSILEYEGLTGLPFCIHARNSEEAADWDYQKGLAGGWITSNLNDRSHAAC